MRIPYKGLAAVGAAAAGAAAVNAAIGRRAGSMRSVIGGHERIYNWRLGKIFYAVAGSGEPILFVHGIGAGASSFEWRRNFEPLADSFTVYAIDLLGFGLSDKPDVAYSPSIYAQLIADFILDVIGRPADVAASSHGAAYAILAAERHRLIISRLLLSCPTGIGVADKRRPMSFVLSAALRLPIFGQSVYYGLTSRPSIETYLKSQIYADPASVTAEVVDHYYTASHQPGADRPIRAFVAGHLNVSVRKEFAALSQPVALVWGEQAKIAPVDAAKCFLEVNPQARLEVLDHSAQLPHEERAEAYNELARDVFARPPEGATVPPHKHTVGYE